MNKVVIFALGVVAGAAAGAGVTYILMKDSKKTELTAEEKRQDYKDAISTNPDELINYYIEQLTDLGCEIEIPEYEEPQRTMVNPLEDDEDEEEIEEDEGPIEPNPNPYEIHSRDLGQLDNWTSETINWYKGDKQMCDDGYDIIDDWIPMVGDIEDRLMKETSDSIYIRNEQQMCDYEILIYDDSYKHAVEGEELGDMAD